MRTLPNSIQHLSDIKSATNTMMQRRNVQALQQEETPMPESVKLWLARLTLLYGVPFEHIISNSAMLPAESIRFFYIDPNWTGALMDGALSIGVHNSGDMLVQTAVNEPLRQSILSEQQLVRRKLANADLPEEVEINNAVAGFLLRSQLVSGWPGLEVIPYEDTAGTITINVLRMERLAPDVMLCLFAKTPALIKIREPKETLYFGVTGGLGGTGILARYLGAQSGQPVATYVPNDPANYVKPKLRDGSMQVLDVIATRDLFKNVLLTYNALRPGTTNLSPADFAIQMVKVAEEQSFISGYQTGEKDCLNN